MSEDWAREVLGYWFDEFGPDRWWTRSEETDATIRARFSDLWNAERHRAPKEFLATPESALAAVILFDQFPRNLFRGEARAFSTDRLARAITEGAIACVYDGGMSGHERHFLYMPFMHSENLADQDRAIRLFETLGDEKALKFAREHHAIIARFGRFPHRNAALGRETRAEEKDAVEAGAGW